MGPVVHQFNPLHARAHRHTFCKIQFNANHSFYTAIQSPTSDRILSEFNAYEIPSSHGGEYED
jgi:hypothetical protein